MLIIGDFRIDDLRGMIYDPDASGRSTVEERG
jgi:hypothetical protein